MGQGRVESGARGYSYSLCPGGKEIQGMLWPLSFHLWERVSNAHLEWWDLPPSHGAGSLV